MQTKRYLLPGACLFLAVTLRVSAQTQYPFQNPDLPLEERVNNVVSLMTLDEKIAFLSQRPGVPWLGIRALGWVEGLHGVAMGRVGNWGNMGGRGGPVQTMAFPPIQLRGFKRVSLRPGDRKTIEMPLPAKSLAYWDVDQHAFVVGAGKIEIRVGASSADIRLKGTIDVK